MRTMRAMAFLPPLSSLLEARRLFEAPEDVARKVTLKIAMEEAMAANLALAMEDQDLRAGAEDVRSARARLFPDVEASVSGATVSQGVAESSSECGRSTTSTAG